jgi:hypothetical protein
MIAVASTTVDLARLQFATTSIYHFLFVPLTLGLSWILVIMESVYVMTGKEIYRDMTRFWGKLFGINFVMGVATGLTLEFQFGTNWAYYSHYVGDIFGAPLAIEGMMAFFLESTFVGLFFFGWDRMGKVTHLLVTFLVALGSNLSALWILIANAWMQNPVGAEFNPDTMRMELTSFTELLFTLPRRRVGKRALDHCCAVEARVVRIQLLHIDAIEKTLPGGGHVTGTPQRDRGEGPWLMSTSHSLVVCSHAETFGSRKTRQIVQLLIHHLRKSCLYSVAGQKSASPVPFVWKSSPISTRLVKAGIAPGRYRIRGGPRCAANVAADA